MAISKAAEASGHAHDQTSGAYDAAKAVSADEVKKAQDAAAAAQKALLAATEASEAAKKEAKAASTAQSQAGQTVIYFQNRLDKINEQVEKAQQTVSEAKSKLTAAENESVAMAKKAAEAKTAVDNLINAIKAAKKKWRKTSNYNRTATTIKNSQNKIKCSEC